MRQIYILSLLKKNPIRFRIDGNLVKLSGKRELHESLVSRIKVMSRLDIAEKRLPQDGRIALKMEVNNSIFVFQHYQHLLRANSTKNFR